MTWFHLYLGFDILYICALTFSMNNMPTCVADSMSVWNLLREFRIRKVHIAVVLNEYGGTIGVCSLLHH